MSIVLQKVDEKELSLENEEEIEFTEPYVSPKEIDKAVMLGEGDCYEAIVERIEIGTLEHFIPNPPDKFRETWEQRKHKLAYRFKIVIPEYGLEGYDIVTISARSNSRMSELRTCYGKIEKNGKVYVCVKNGRLRISCPPIQRMNNMVVVNEQR